jgi:CheY-like chemotaxis protein
MTGKRVLVADDLTPVLSTVAKILDKSFDVVGMVTNGQTALDSTLALKPDLVILDISMPDMSGIEVAKRATQMREQRQDHIPDGSSGPGHSGDLPCRGRAGLRGESAHGYGPDSGDA